MIKFQNATDLIRKGHLFIVFILLAFLGTAQKYRAITESELKEKIGGYWIGQLAGNYIGFPFENLYTEEPIPVFIDRYMNYKDVEQLGLRMNLDDRRGFVSIMAHAMGGAWSDDDTDIEFVILHGLEEYGLDIDYTEMALLRKKHIRRFIWSSNATVKDLIDQGYLPPETGSKELNPHWYTLGSQLYNEIWGAVYPGLVEQAAEKAEWSARITHADWATHGTVLFISMYSAAFFENDIEKILEMGMDQMPKDSPYLKAVKEVIKWYHQNDDWKKTRQLIHDKYYDEFEGFEFPYPLGSALINGLNGIMALLYGEGDFIKSVGIATTTGYDCDNQAATIGGLLGIMNGASSIPKELTHELPSLGRWETPFNNTYINYSRDDLPNYNKITDIIDRIAVIAGQAILANGGRKEMKDNKVIYYVPYHQ